MQFSSSLTRNPAYLQVSPFLQAWKGVEKGQLGSAQRSWPGSLNLADTTTMAKGEDEALELDA